MMQTKLSTTRGGARVGAGRKPNPKPIAITAVLVYVPSITVRMLDARLEGTGESRTAWINKAILNYM